MKREKNKSRTGTLYIFLSLILVVISFLLVLKPILKKAYPLKYEDCIIACSNQYNLNKYLVMGIISAESKFKENAISSENAKGLMQVKDETANWCIEKFEISTECDPHELNIRIGCAYFRYLLDKYHGNQETALAAYNAGEGNVSEWLREQGGEENSALSSIPYGETSDYVKRVEKRAKIYKFLY